MRTRKRSRMAHLDVHAEIAHAHAARAEYMRLAFAQVPALFKRLTGKLQPSRQRLPHSGSWA